MKILTNNNVVFAKGKTIERGKWNNDLTTETYRIKNGDSQQYAVITDFGLHEVESVPEDFESNKYCYTEAEGFYLNPDFKEPISEEYMAGYDQAVMDLLGEGK